MCPVGAFVIVRDPQSYNQTYVARVEEIVQVEGSNAHLIGEADGVLVRRAVLGRAASTYGMPSIGLTSW